MRLFARCPGETGWIRIGSTGWGLAWKPIDAPALFSERNGYERWWSFGRYRYHFLRRCR